MRTVVVLVELTVSERAQETSAALAQCWLSSPVSLRSDTTLVCDTRSGPGHMENCTLKDSGFMKEEEAHTEQTELSDL